MMKSNRRLAVLLIADEAAGAHALRILSKSDHLVAGVLTNQGSGQDSILQKPSISDSATQMGVPVLDAKRVQNPDFAAWMVDHEVDVLLNVHALYRICPEVIRAARVGAFNLHPGPLPAYSGLNAPSWAVYNEEATHAVTIHHITDTIDTGNIAYETHFPITSKDTGLSVSIRCVKEGLILIEQLLNDLSRDSMAIPSRPQSSEIKRTVYKRNQIPGNGLIQWQQSARKIDAFIRASNYSPFVSPWGEPCTIWKGKVIAISKTEISERVCDASPGTVGDPINGKSSVATADRWILIDKCKLDGKTAEASSFLTPGDSLCEK
ncbi:MAG: hypothetical protein LAT57_05225 [Balneolales bacterium]|nr:hypothetical protein [Balneolales bacterium]